MAWEDDEFDAYTKRVNEAIAKEDKERDRATKLQVQSQSEWATLRDCFQQLVKRFNSKSPGAEILRSVTAQFDRLDIRLNNHRKFQAHWNSQDFAVEFDGEGCDECRRRFSLTVDNKDNVVWVDGHSIPHQPEAIAESILSTFLRPGV